MVVGPGVNSQSLWPDKEGQVCSRRMLSFRMCMILGFIKYLLAYEQVQGNKDNPER